MKTLKLFALALVALATLGSCDKDEPKPYNYTNTIAVNGQSYDITAEWGWSSSVDVGGGEMVDRHAVEFGFLQSDNVTKYVTLRIPKDQGGKNYTLSASNLGWNFHSYAVDDGDIQTVVKDVTWDAMGDLESGTVYVKYLGGKGGDIYGNFEVRFDVRFSDGAHFKGNYKGLVEWD